MSQVDVQTTVHSGRMGLVFVLAASLVSMLGSAASFVAVPWFVLSTTGSATKTGLVSAATGAGVVLSGLLFGPLLDRLGHRLVAVAADFTAAAAIGTVPLLQPPLWVIAGLVFVSAAAGMVSSTARQSMLATLSATAGASLPRVSAAYWTMQRATLVLAAIPVGILIAALGPLSVLWVNSASFVAAALIILFGLYAAPQNREEQAGYLNQLRAGLHFMRTDDIVRLVLVTAILLAALEGPLLPVIIPSLSAEAGPAGLGHLVFAYAGGMLAGAIGYGIGAARLPRCAFTLACLATVGAGYLTLTMLPAVGKLAVLAVMGVATGPLAPLIVSTVQQRTPALLLGRVTGALISSIMAAIPLGRAITGYAIDLVGLTAVLAVSAVGYLGAAGYLMVNSRFRRALAPAPMLDSSSG